MLALYVAMTLAYAALTWFLIASYYNKKWSRWSVTLKTATSVAFLVIALVCHFLHASPTPFFIVWFISMIFCALGDHLLAQASAHPKKFFQYFLPGGGAFALAHLGFCVTLTLFSASMRLYWFDIALPLVCLAGIAPCVFSRKFRLRKLAVPAFGYALVVSVMAARSLAFAVSSGGSVRGLLIGVGGVLFLISDGILLFAKFYHRPKPAWHGVNLFTYYLGMLLFAFAA